MAGTEASEEAAAKAALRGYLGQGICPFPFVTIVRVYFGENVYRINNRKETAELFSVLYLISILMERVGEKGRQQSAFLLERIDPRNIYEMVLSERCEDLVHDLALLASRVRKLHGDLEDFEPLGAKVEVIY